MINDIELEQQTNKECKLTNAFTQLRYCDDDHDLDDSDKQGIWRMKERMKTVSVALVMCLNVGVDPPDVMKPTPCSVMECWVDPYSLPPQKAIEAIAGNLLKQYERWQPRARYKQSLDPTVEDVKKLCTSLRRNAKDERVLFHYNGHGVPKPTVNGEIWVFNRSYTQYIPLSVYDLQQWMAAPSIYVYDCSCAGLIVKSFNQFAVQHEKEFEMNMNCSSNGLSFSSASHCPPQYKNCIQLASCADDQLLPMNPEMPADLFTSCLTTPIKIALRWFIRQSAGKLMPAINLDTLEKIPGQLSDRRTMLGELNWIFTAITDTIAWNTLSRDLFHRLFRQDLLVASLFRNFLLAERIMRTYDCTPVSSPGLPPTFHHPMWQAWDLAVDNCLSQLPAILAEEAQYKPSTFFTEQLTAFEVWLTYGSRPENHPEQLPIVLQVLLSQVHRLRALDLLGRFLDLGSWAVNLALSVGIFPYVLKLLQSSARELRPLLVSIWVKVLAVDGSCQADLVRDNGHRYFMNVLSDTFSMPAGYRTMAAFVMACIVKNHPLGQEAALQGTATNGNLIDHCLEQLYDANGLLRQWLVICLAHIWENYDKARWIATRNTAPEKLFVLLDDPVPEVRAAAVYALGTFVNSAQERIDQANDIDHSIAFTLINKSLHDSCMHVRKELLIALHWLVLIFENNFFAIQKMEEEKAKEIAQNSQLYPNLDTTLNVGTPPLGLRKVASRDRLSTITINKLLSVPISITSNTHQTFGSEALTPPNTCFAQNVSMKRVNSSNSLSNFSTNNSSMVPSIANVYWTIWKAITTLANDPHPEVANLAHSIIDDIKSRMAQPVTACDLIKESNCDPSLSEPASPNANHMYLNESPTSNHMVTSHSRNTTPVRDNSITANRSFASSPFPHPQHQFNAFITPYSRKRTIFGREPSVSARSEEGNNDESINSQRQPLITSSYINWCIKSFGQFCYPEELDSESPSLHEKEWRISKNKNIKELATKEIIDVDVSRIDEPLFHHKNQQTPQFLALHPYEERLVVAEKDSFSTWTLEPNQNNNHNVIPLLGTYSNSNINSRITAMQLLHASDITLLMLGCDDGSVRVWRNCGFHEKFKPKLVTAFHIFNDLQPIAKSSGVILFWNENDQKLIASGEPRIIRLWDATKEMKIRDLTTGADSCVTTISTDGNNLICVGCGDGSVRVFDDRLMPNDSRVLTFYEHKSWIVNAHIYPDNEKHVHIISGSLTGDIKWYDKRLSSSIKSINTGFGMTAMSVHPEADVFACGLGNQSVSNGYQAIQIYTLDAIPGSVVRHNDGILSQRIGHTCSLAFHPLKALLAAGSTDNYITLYGPSKYF